MGILPDSLVPGHRVQKCTFFNPCKGKHEGNWVHPDAYYVTVEGQSAWGCPHCQQIVEADKTSSSSRTSTLRPLGRHQIARYSRYRLACAAVVTFSAAFLIYGLQEKNQVWYADVGIACLIMALPFLVSVILILEEQISSAYETHKGAAYAKRQMALGGILTWVGLLMIFWSYSHLFALVYMAFSLLGMKLVLSTSDEEMAAKVVLHHSTAKTQGSGPDSAPNTGADSNNTHDPAKVHKNIAAL